MNFEDKLFVPIGAIIVGVAIDIFSLIFDYDSFFGFGTLVIALSLLAISLILYSESVRLRKNE